MNSIIAVWKDHLKHLLFFYEKKRGNIFSFYLLLFLYFIVINVICYWVAMYTAFPELTHGGAGVYYYKVQFPVGILGALFDSLSFFVTIFLVRHALSSKKDIQYIAHLLVDLIIAVLATFWVVFVFSFSGWLVNLISYAPQVLADRNAEYQGLLFDAVSNPFNNMRNIYFGIVMGISAMIPTCIHIYMFLRACMHTLFRQPVTMRR